ncbi:(2,3-dihydroxybenzoyl)adenylate synthase [Paenibacillus sp. UNC499MF]|uniref:(2,3-dihydroxybenzoyl)adenylate synthase n=1 Tax=Paenibacillus sp. UNC499MF TaxID=1502751 RepID=UPI00089FCF4D|nr:(2,3-dihydroxybenzoyl)adenylate synthase [Paenibacillus sp. UNC499MF]SEF72007.1 2,3-dihydroxybenzoate-AMP ligase [Paenibacillus sp. UNC499MF]
MSEDYPYWPDEFVRKYREAGCWRGETFGGMLRERAAAHGGRTAIVGGEERVSYAELDLKADRLAAGLKGLGIRKGDRVVVQLPNVPVFFDVIFALFRLGALPVFALPLHRRSEIVHIASYSEASAYITIDKYGGFDYRTLASEVKAEVPCLRHALIAGNPGDHLSLEDLYVNEIPAFPDKLHPLSLNASEDKAADSEVQPDAGPSPGDTAFLQLSGGSTGLPKLIPRTHDDYIYSLRRSAEVCGLDGASVYLAALPVAHNFPLSSPGALGTLYAGGTVVLARSGSPDEVFPLIRREKCTIAAVVPPLALLWLEAARTRGENLHPLQVLQVGGAKFGEEAAKRVKPELGCTLQQVFGMAEGLVNYTRLDDPESIITATQGRPMSPLDEVLILDDEDRPAERGTVGHLLTRGPYTIRGYYKAPEHNARSFTPDGFYRTGDLARLTPEGYLVVEGRAKDQINRGGDKVGTEEVENHLLAHPAVRDAAIVAMPDEFLGERSCAFILSREPHTGSDELRSFLRSRGLAAYKIPDRFEFIDSFPQTGVGKVSKKELRQRIAALLEHENGVKS